MNAKCICFVLHLDFCSFFARFFFPTKFLPQLSRRAYFCDTCAISKDMRHLSGAWLRSFDFCTNAIVFFIIQFVFFLSEKKSFELLFCSSIKRQTHKLDRTKVEQILYQMNRSHWTVCHYKWSWISRKKLKWKQPYSLHCDCRGNMRQNEKSVIITRMLFFLFFSLGLVSNRIETTSSS